MALDAVTYGRVEEAEENILNNINDVKSTVDTLPDKVEEKLDPVQTDMAKLVENVQKQVDELREIVENSPSGVTPPCLGTISSSSNDNGIDISYMAYTGTNADAGEPNVMDNWPIVVTKGVMVRYSSEKYPENINDGTLAFIDEDLFEVDENGTKKQKTKSQTVVGLTIGYTYYFTAFTYSNYGVYNESMSRSNCTKCQWTGTKGTLTVNVTQDYDCKPLGEYTATMTPTAGGEAITKTQSGSATVVFIGLEAGEYTLSFSAPQYFTAPQSESVTVVSGQSQTVDKVFTFSAGTLSDASWELIDELSKQASNFWSIGDTKDIVVSGETITVEIIGFNHDDLSDGSGKAGITFGMKNLMANQKRMNRKNTNAGSYAGSEMNTYVGTTFYNGMPAEVRNVIKSVKKVTGNSTGSGSWTGTRTDNFKTWLFSEAEVFGTKKHSVGNEGSKYARFTSNSLRIKKLSNGSSAYDWWLRSPILDNTSAFCGVNTNGDGSGYNATYSSGVCVGFCV